LFTKEVFFEKEKMVQRSLVFFLLISIAYFGLPQEILPTPIYQLQLEQNLHHSQYYGHGRRLFNSSAPLFEGIGTHYSFIWVGTPPQRVSVIMDTGSHHTAFPCVGCNCGKRVCIHF
jgi:hypothetical protein